MKGIKCFQFGLLREIQSLTQIVHLLLQCSSRGDQQSTDCIATGWGIANLPYKFYLLTSTDVMTRIVYVVLGLMTSALHV